MWNEIIKIYPELTGEEMNLFNSKTVIVQDNSDGKGPFIAVWNHPTLPKPEIGGI
jgi:hypothetical protein